MKIKSGKFKEGLGYFSLVSLSKVLHIPFYLQLHLDNLQKGRDQNKHLGKESVPHYCDPKSQVFSNGFLF